MIIPSLWSASNQDLRIKKVISLFNTVIKILVQNALNFVLETIVRAWCLVSMGKSCCLMDTTWFCTTLGATIAVVYTFLGFDELLIKEDKIELFLKNSSFASLVKNEKSRHLINEQEVIRRHVCWSILRRWSSATPIPW